MLDIQEVLINADASPDEVAAVQEVFDSRDLGVEVRAEWRKAPQTGNGAFWMTLVKLTALPVGAFVTAFMAKAGEETFGVLREWVHDLRAARRHSTLGADGWIEIDDTDGTQLMIGDVPDRAYEALEHVDWGRLKGGMIMWDDRAGEWRSPPLSG